MKKRILKQSLNILVIVICYRYDVIGLVWGMLALNFVAYYINSYFSKLIINYGFFEQIKDLTVPVVLTFIVIIILYSLSLLIEENITKLIILPIIGVLFVKLYQ